MNPKVSVCIPTYQHAGYISQCLDSVLMQETDFEYEILVGEDGSKDGTREICIEYAEKHPEKIRLFLNDRKNVIYINGRPSGRWNFVNLLRNAEGQYIALCEGDDYWTDPLKLQKQVDFLESHQECVLCFHNVFHFYEDGGKPTFLHCPSDQRQISSMKELLRESFISTCSVTFRHDALGELPEWYYKIIMGDLPLFLLLLGNNGRAGYINETMATYRIHPSGYWSMHQNEVHRQEGIIEMYRFVDLHFNSRYKGIVRQEISRHLFSAISFFAQAEKLQDAREYASIKISRYRNYLTLRWLIQILIRVYLPRVYGLIRDIGAARWRRSMRIL